MQVQTADQINSVVDHLAAKLAVPASQLWGVLLRQARIEGLLDLGYAVVLFLVAIGGGFFVRYAIRRHAKEGPYNTWDMGAFFSGALALLTLVCALSFAYSAVIELANPQYFAAHAILGGVK